MTYGNEIFEKIIIEYPVKVLVDEESERERKRQRRGYNCWSLGQSVYWEKLCDRESTFAERTNYTIRLVREGEVFRKVTAHVFEQHTSFTASRLVPKHLEVYINLRMYLSGHSLSQFPSIFSNDPLYFTTTT